MAPRKGKCQGKRHNIKIKSKVNMQKRRAKAGKKESGTVKPLGKLKWIKGLAMPGEGAKKGSPVPNWLNRCVYKHAGVTCSGENSRGSAQYAPKDGEDKSSSSDVSEECNCLHSRYSNSKCRIQKRKLSSNSLVAKYIKSGMDHVASFIVESAIRFGKEHGVVVPDKSTPDVYEITSPGDRVDEKSRKIRFRVPDKALGYEDAKKAMWRSSLKKSSDRGSTDYGAGNGSNSGSWESTADSLEDILPILEKLKEGGIVSSELDLEKLVRTTGSESKDRLRDREREGERERERDRDRERERERDRERERAKERFRAMVKRYKSVSGVTNNNSADRNYKPSGKEVWKRCKRDSLELGRKRLRAATCPRKEKTKSPSPSHSPSPY